MGESETHGMNTFVKPARNWFGVTTELTWSVRYTCTTSFPSTDPVFSTVTVTVKSSVVPIAYEESSRLVLHRQDSEHVQIETEKERAD